MIDAVWLKAVVRTLVLPPTGPLLLAALGLGLVPRYPRFGRALAGAGVALLLALSTSVVADYLTDFVGTSEPLDLARARDAQAVVILGGGVRRNALEFGGDTLGALTLERVRYGARVARMTGLPVLVTGGSALGGEPEAHVMQAALETEYGVTVRWTEARSRTTRENAVLSADLLRGQGIRRVVLVAHGFDMRRARREFEAAGIGTVPAPTGLHGTTPPTVLDFLPSMTGLRGSYFATYEILANVVRVANGGRW